MKRAAVKINEEIHNIIHIHIMKVEEGRKNNINGGEGVSKRKLFIFLGGG